MIQRALFPVAVSACCLLSLPASSGAGGSPKKGLAASLTGSAEFCGEKVEPYVRISFENRTATTVHLVLSERQVKKLSWPAETWPGTFRYVIKVGNGLDVRRSAEASVGGCDHGPCPAELRDGPDYLRAVEPRGTLVFNIPLATKDVPDGTFQFEGAIEWREKTADQPPRDRRESITGQVELKKDSKGCRTVRARPAA